MMFKVLSSLSLSVNLCRSKYIRIQCMLFEVVHTQLVWDELYFTVSMLLSHTIYKL